MPTAPVSGLVARAAARLVLVTRGLDPTAVSVPEVGHVELGRDATWTRCRLPAGRRGRHRRVGGALRRGGRARRPRGRRRLRVDPARRLTTTPMAPATGAAPPRGRRSGTSDRVTKRAPFVGRPGQAWLAGPYMGRSPRGCPAAVLRPVCNATERVRGKGPDRPLCTYRRRAGRRRVGASDTRLAVGGRARPSRRAASHTTPAVAAPAPTAAAASVVGGGRLTPATGRAAAPAG